MFDIHSLGNETLTQKCLVSIFSLHIFAYIFPFIGLQFVGIYGKHY